MRKKNILYVVHCVDTEGPLNESLKKLQTDYVDLYLIHWPLFVKTL